MLLKFFQLFACMFFILQSVVATRFPFSSGKPAQASVGMVLFNDITTLNPFDLLDDISVLVMIQMHEGLVRVDSHGRVVPGLAEKWVVSDDGKKVIFDLKKDLFFSDGTPITVEDVVYSLQRGVKSFHVLCVKNAKDVCAGNIPKERLGIRGENNQIVVDLEYPDHFFLLTLCETECAIVKKSYLEAHGNAGLEKPHFPCTGPYMLEWRKRLHAIRLVRNPYYKGACGNIQTIDFKVCTDFQTALNMYRNGDIHVVRDLPMDFVAGFKEKYGSEFHQYPILAAYSFVINSHVKGLDKIPIRQALSMSLDRDHLIKVVDAYGTPLYGSIPEGFHGYTPQRPLWSYWLMEERVAEAKRRLAKEGYTLKKPLTVSYTHSTSMISKRLANYLRITWKAIGVNLVPYSREGEMCLQEIRAKNFETASTGRFALSPTIFFDELMCKSIHNVTHYCNPSYDELVYSGMAEKNPERRSKLLAKASLIQMEDSHQFGLFQSKGNVLVHKRIRGFVPNNQDMILFWQMSVR